MTTYTLATGRQIHLKRLSITGTYSGVMEGSPETASAHIRKSLPDEIRRIVPGNIPWLILDQKDHPLPPWLWIMGFTSREGITHDDADYASELMVSWFSDEVAFDKSINGLISTLIANIDWDRYAREYDIMDF